MKSLLIACTSILLFYLTGDNPTDYLSVEGPLNFNKTEFILKWSAKPKEHYYIQEYLPEGETLEDFEQMLTIHLFETDIRLEDAVNQKIDELNERKKYDSVCNYQVTESPDGKEFIIDFILGESKDNKMTTVEFNVYHYRQIDLDKQNKGIAVYAYSQRSYAGDITDFFKKLREDRNIYLNEMIMLEKPSIKLKEK